MGKIRTFLIIILCAFFLCSCNSTRTVYFPAFNPIMPNRPVLEETSENTPIEAVRNTIKLMSYAEQLETVCEAWKSFYEELQK